MADLDLTAEVVGSLGTAEGDSDPELVVVGLHFDLASHLFAARAYLSPEVRATRLLNSKLLDLHKYKLRGPVAEPLVAGADQAEVERPVAEPLVAGAGQAEAEGIVAALVACSGSDRAP